MKKVSNFLVFFSITSFLINANLNAQETSTEVFEPVKLSGPRFGVTYLTGETAEKMKTEYDMYPLITQFGWQLETRFFTLENGACGVAELVGAVGGLEQGKFLPSASFLIGYRSPQGIEFGVGPNLSVSGFAFVFGGGVTFKGEYVNVPLNLAFVTSDKGVRISLLVGMTFQGKFSLF